MFCYVLSFPYDLVFIFAFFSFQVNIFQLSHGHHNSWVVFQQTLWVQGMRRRQNSRTSVPVIQCIGCFENTFNVVLVMKKKNVLNNFLVWFLLWLWPHMNRICSRKIIDVNLGRFKADSMLFNILNWYYSTIFISVWLNECYLGISFKELYFIT